MPIYQELINFNEMFYQLKEPPIIINDLPNTTEDEREYIKQLITTRYSSDMLSILPSCQCGQTRGEFEVRYECPECKTIVKSQIDEDIEPLVWFRRPKDVAPLMNPIVFTMLRHRFKKSGYEIMNWLTDTTYTTDRKQPTVLNNILATGIQRGYNYFVENFDTVMDVLFSIKDFKLKRGKRDYLRELIGIYRHQIFSDYIPLPNKSLLVIENTNVGRYVDNTIVAGIDVISSIASIDRKFINHHVRVRENRTAKCISRLGVFYETFISKNVSPKPGLFRKHIFGSRTHFSFRAVITSLTKAHAYNEIHIPWGVGVTVLRDHLLSKMLKLGYALNDAIGILHGHVHNYNVMLDQFMKEIIAESPKGSLVCILQRNPSLLQGSAQRMNITHVKTDPNDNTIGMSILCVRAPNAD